MPRPYTFAQRLQELLDIKHMTKSELAVAADINKSNITRYLKGDYEAKQDVVHRISQRLNVSESWLMGYDVPVEREDSKSSRVSEIIPMPTAQVERRIDPIWDGLNEDGQDQLCQYGDFLLGQERYRAPEQPKRPIQITRVIPLLGQSFAAGAPESPGDLFMSDYHTTDPRAEFAIHVNGNSMEPWLPDGSIALGIKREPEIGEVGAFYLDGGFLVKQFVEDNFGNVYLLSLNRAREDADETIWHDTDRDLRCVGTILMKERIPLP